MHGFREIADALSAQIMSGELKPGERLPPQRDFAYRRGIAASTAARVYSELARRGLVTGETGRGTFVRLPTSRQAPALTEPATAPIDLELNFPIVDEQAAMTGRAVAALLQGSAMEDVSRPIGATGTPAARAIVADHLRRGAWRADPEAIVFAGNGRQAIAATLSALAPPGSRFGVEVLTYPVFKGLAARLGIILVPIACDTRGMLPDAILRAHAAAPLSGLYVQPSLQNPVGTTMDAARRREIAAVLETTRLVAIEDGIYGFLTDEEPLAHYAPAHAVLVDSLSKRIAPGTTAGFIAAPLHLRGQIIASVRSGCWAPSGFPLALGLQMMSDGSAHRIGELKREDAMSRNALARRHLGNLRIDGDPRAYHVWATLPDHWRAETFAMFAARRGIAVVPGSAFAVSPGQAPNAVRLALASPPLAVLADSLDVLNVLAASSPDQIE